MNVEKTNRDFGWALNILKDGGSVCRAGWNGKNMWLRKVHSSEYEIAPGALDELVDNPGTKKLLPWIGMKTADGCFVPWLASQTDVLAEDWQLAN